LGTAQSGIPPFNVKTIRDRELLEGELRVLLNSATAYSRGLREGDRVRLSAGQGGIVARVHIFEGIVPDAVALTLGFGHTALDAFSRHKGANVAELFTTAPEAGTGLTVWNRLGVSIARV
jgi:anaerobic selenocysteine-containing dehydrogenase